MFDNIVRVYSKNKELLATFDGETAGLSEEAMRNLMVAPTVRIEQNGPSSLSFQMLSSSEKWQEIKHPENLYHLNDRWYTPLSENAYTYKDDNGVQIVNATLLETWSLLSRRFNQVYNCGIYTYAKAKFVEYTNDGAKFTINASDCMNPGETISTQKAWEQVKAWEPRDDDGNQLTYSILTSEKFKPTNWKDAPAGVFIKSFVVQGNTATAIIESRAKVKVGQVYQYNSGKTYTLDVKPLPAALEGVKINTTVVSGGSYTTNEKDVSNYSYNASTGVVTVNYTPGANEQVNAVMISYLENNLGEISAGATCTFAYGAEAIDEHTFVILPKAKNKYKLTIDGVSYEDNEVKDSRGVVLPRGSGGYAMWAALKNSGWTLGICDVIAKNFDTSIDYGCFNVESDMKDVLYNIHYIQQLYGGILDWDSEHNILNYRAENDIDYQSYNDGFNEWTGYEFREGKNMVDRPQVTYDNDLITRAYLLGYGNLNVKNVNSGKSYIEDFSYTDAVYKGYLSQPLIYDTRDEGGQKQLLYWGKKELSKKCRPRVHIELSVTDVRTVEGLEHEVFDINDVVRVHYWDQQTKTSHVEERRIVLWEYNAFAMQDSTVELGDKTANLVELFRLVYNKSITTPDADNSGNISSNNIHMNGIGWGGDSNSWFGSGSSDSLTRYMEAIAQTSTENADAIAGLIFDTSSIHSQVDLFAMYQKQTDNLFTQTYAGLTFYADEKKAEAIVSANNYTETVKKELDGTITSKISQTNASLRAYADSVGSKVEATATGYYNTLNSKIGTLEVNTAAGFTAEQNARQALAQQFAYYQSDVNGRINTVQSSITNLANDQYALSQSVAQFNNSISSIYQYVDNQVANIDIEAAVNQTLDNASISISAGGGFSSVGIGAYEFLVSSAYTTISSSTITLKAPGIELKGNVYINGTLIE